MNFEQYRNTLPHPEKKEFSTVYYYKGGQMIHSVKAGDPTPLPTSLMKDAVREVVVDEVAFKAARHVYYANTNKLTEQFFADVKADLGITENPKADLLMSKAWDLGHSAGFAEVYNYALDLVDLIKD